MIILMIGFCGFVEFAHMRAGDAVFLCVKCVPGDVDRDGDAGAVGVVGLLNS